MTRPAFELERFTLRDGELEVRGHWRSERPRRFRHVRLVTETPGGRRRRLAPREPAPLRAGPDGEAWRALFEWPAKQPPATASLEIGTDLLVELPAPTRIGDRVGARPAPPEQAEAPPNGESGVRAELEELRATIARLEIEADEARTAAEREAALVVEGVAAEAHEAREAVDRLESELAEERAEIERLKADILGERELVAELRKDIAHRRQHAPERPTLRTYDPHARPRTPMQLPRTPADPVNGEAPLAIRAIAVALAAGVLVMLILIVAAIF